MTEDDVRRIVREELAKCDTRYPHVPHGVPDDAIMRSLPMPKYEYQSPGYSPPACSGHEVIRVPQATCIAR